jgi:hypothetical protein
MPAGTEAYAANMTPRVRKNRTERANVLSIFGPALLVWGALTQRHAVIGVDSLIEHCDGLVKRLVTLCVRQRAPYRAGSLNDA